MRYSTLLYSIIMLNKELKGNPNYYTRELFNQRDKEPGSLKVLNN